MVKDTNMTELEKCECVLYLMTITPIMKIEGEKMGAMGILQVIDDGVIACMYRVCSKCSKIYMTCILLWQSFCTIREE